MSLDAKPPLGAGSDPRSRMRQPRIDPTGNGTRREPHIKPALSVVQSALAGGRLSARSGVSFCLVGGRNAVFAEAQQSLFELDDAAAYVWCRIEEGASPATIVAELVERGLSPDGADTAVLGLVETWLQRALLQFIPAAGRFAAPLHAIDIDIAGLRARVGFSHEALAARVVPYLAHLETTADPVTAFALHAIGDLVHLFEDRRHLCLMRARQALPVLQRYLTEAILARLGTSFALHAATLVKDGRALLVHGRPGAGKTTLSLALDAASFRLGGDDIAILDAKGRVRGVPYVPALKAGSWPIVQRFRADVREHPVHQRLDGRRVRYVPPIRFAPARSHPVKAIVLLSRLGSGAAALKEVEPLAAIASLIGTAYSTDHRMTAARWKALVGCVSRARVFELSYARLDKAVNLLERMWDA
jgi:hypothetical protein